MVVTGKKTMTRSSLPRIAVIISSLLCHLNIDSTNGAFLSHIPVSSKWTALAPKTIVGGGRPMLLSSLSSSRALQYSKVVGQSKHDDEDELSSSFDIDSAREQLESLMSKSEDMDDDEKSNKNKSKDSQETDNKVLLENLLSLSTYFNEKEIHLPPPPPITSIDRDRRMAEMEGLKKLANGDEAKDELWKLWYSERGSKAETDLRKADEYMGAPSKWRHAEKMLKELIEEYGLYYVEPMNRLATLYFIQGRFTQAYRLCKVILEIKPWHFGALAGIVSVCVSMGRRDEARIWARRKLPNPIANSSFPPFPTEGPSNPQRTEWVDHALSLAGDALLAAERRTKKSLGKPEEYYLMTGKVNNEPLAQQGKEQEDGNDEESAWQ